jgi:large conductance mechanosensitive channel
MSERKSLIQEFKEFLASGDVILLAIAFILGGLVKAVVDNVVKGVFQPIIAAIVGKPDFSAIGFDLGKSRVGVGLVMNAVIDLVLTGAALFVIYKWYQAMKKRQGVIVPPPPGPTEAELLTEIRDLLRDQGK